MRTPANLLLFASCAVVASCFCLLFLVGGTETTQEFGADDPDPDRRMAQAVARIAAESRGEGQVPESQAPSGLVHSSPRESSQSPAVPPDGFSFAVHHGRMAKDRFDDSPKAPGPLDRDLDWLTAADTVERLADQATAAGRDWSFGWIRLPEGGSHRELRDALTGSGAAIVGTSGNLVRARLPGSPARLQAIAKLPGVAGLAAAPPETKTTAFGNELLDAPAHRQMPIFVTLMADDPDGRWRQAMTDLGATIAYYDSALRVYTAAATVSVIQSLAASDFVQGIEPIPPVTAANDTAVPAMGADAMRAPVGFEGLFSGIDGSDIPVGVADTGLNINHVDIASNRESICGAVFTWDSPSSDPSTENADLWIDADGHGTHVTGTIVGNGADQRRFAGMAPSVSHIRFAKVLDRFGSGWGDGVIRGMDYLAEHASCEIAGVQSAAVMPEIVSMSLGGSSILFRGRGTDERKLDSLVWNHGQLYVVAQGNSSRERFSDFPTAKNSLGVGAVFDSGELAAFSSLGPTADGRLIPKVVGTGVGVVSPRGSGNPTGYARFNGTSMATPSVAGVATLLMHAVPAHRKQPALARARLMASAIRPDPWLENTLAFPSNNSEGPGAWQAGYGMGQVSARTTILNRDEADGWINGSVTAELLVGEYAQHDIVVPEGASRLDLVLTWDEPPADTISSTVLNDLDLWLDFDGDCGSAACGEYSSVSRRDNVEWTIVMNPAPGTYRAKILAHRVYGPAPRAALAWTLIRGSSTPNLRIESDSSVLRGQGEHEVTLSLATDAYVASGVRLHVDCRDAGDLSCERVAIKSMVVQREDGLPVEMIGERGGQNSAELPRSLVGETTPLGEVGVGETRTIRLVLVTPPALTVADLAFSVSSWNAKSASVVVGVERGDRSIPDSERPTNDSFAAAAMIEGEEGATNLDLLLASVEPGEPREFDWHYPRPVASVWYAWTAPRTGAFDFGVGSGPATAVEVFVGDRITALERIASGKGGATVFADGDRTYRIRVGHVSRGAATRLIWSPMPRPPNDDFADATVLDGAEGKFKGNNRGATLENDEWFGSFAATTWHRWTAPHDGHWNFDVPYDQGHLVFAVTGDSPSTVRLISEYPQRVRGARVHARAGTEYRIVVANRIALYESAGAYDLSWTSTASTVTNDQLAGADSFERASSSQRWISVNEKHTVEAGEPLATGSRTRWWRWEAPTDGSFTWAASGSVESSASKLRIAAFEGAVIDDLRLLGRTEPNTATPELVFDAVAGERYWFSAGFVPDDIAAYTDGFAHADVKWGPTPANDNPSEAVALSGWAGSVAGSNRFATTERGWRTDVLGGSALWWTYQVPVSGWRRFRVDTGGVSHAITVYRESGDSLGVWEVVASSRWQRSSATVPEVQFYAAAGFRYRIALGTINDHRSEFQMKWEEVDPPAWIRYAGRLGDGELDALGNRVEIRGPRGLALRDEGDALYVATDPGLVVFERDIESGELAFVQLLETPLPDASLVWDSHRTRLLAGNCAEWHVFTPVEAGPELEHQGEIDAADDPGTCADTLSMDADGTYLYRVGSGRLDVFSVDTSGDLRHVEGLDGVKRAVLGRDGRNVYTMGDFAITTYQRVMESDLLVWRSARETDTALLAMTIDQDDSTLFVFRHGRANVYGLTVHGGNRSVDAYRREFTGPPCRAASRANLVAEAICRDMAYAVQWRPTEWSLRASDYVRASGYLDPVPARPDRFNNFLPAFGEPVALAESPDDLYVYVTTKDMGILTFARPRPNEPGSDPDLSVRSAEVTNAEPDAGETFSLDVVVHNSGRGESPETSLRYYLSTDAFISQADTEVGTATVAGLDLSATSDHSTAIEAPLDQGIYHYGACVDTVDGEFYTGNNCSDGVAVTVAVPDLVVESAAVDDDRPAPGGTITLSMVVRNLGTATAPATTLRYYRSSDNAISISDTEIHSDAVHALEASGTSDHSTSVVVPSESGTYYYGACIDAVEHETDTQNNCSAAVTVTAE